MARPTHGHEFRYQMTQPGEEIGACGKQLQPRRLAQRASAETTIRGKIGVDPLVQIGRERGGEADDRHFHDPIGNLVVENLAIFDLFGCEQVIGRRRDLCSFETA